MSELNNNKIEQQNNNEQLEGTYSGRYFEPRMDIYETKEALVMEAELPGICDKDIDLDLHDNELTIMAKCPDLEAKNEGKFLLQEFSQGHYMRKFTLPEGLDTAAIEATMKNGILRINLPKATKAAPRKIIITNG